MTSSRVAAVFGLVVCVLMGNSVAHAGGTGACCYLNEQCGEMFTEADCVGSGGIYQGNTTQCTGVVCDCAVDIDMDGAVQFDDIVAVLSAWGTVCGGCPEDVDGSGTVGGRDLLLVLGFFGDTCGGTIFGLSIGTEPTVTFEDVSALVGTPAGFTSWRAVVHLDPVDRVFAVGGPIEFSTDDPAGLANDGGVFAGSGDEDFPPDGPPFAEFYDSFITIGPTSGGMGLNITFTPAFAGGAIPRIAGTSFSEPDGAWFDAGTAMGPDVPIAQFTVGDGFDVNLDGVIAWQTGQPGPRFTPFSATTGPGPFVIQDAIDAASNGDTILIPDGVYNETLDLLDREITLKAENRRAVTIDAQGAGPVITCNGGQTSLTVIEGLILTGGLGPTCGCGDIFEEVGGGGMFVENASPTIRDCLFVANSAIGNGNGIMLRASQSVVEDCDFESNTSLSLGGAVAATRSEFSLTNCTMTANEGLLAGSIFLLEAECVMTDCTLRDNGSFDVVSGIADSVWNQGKLIVRGTNEISPDFSGGGPSVGYVQFLVVAPLVKPQGSPVDSGVLAYEVEPGGVVGSLTVNATIDLKGELEVTYLDPAPPAVTDVILRYDAPTGLEWELVDTLGLPTELAAAPLVTGVGPIEVRMELLPTGPEVEFEPPLPPVPVAGRTASFEYANVDPGDPGVPLDDFIVIADNAGTDQVAVYLNDGAGGFLPAVFPDLGANRVDRLIVADFDCDGDPDIAAFERRGAANVFVLLNDGLGTFTPLAAGPVAFNDPGGDGYDSIIAYDADGDGDMDLLGFRIESAGAGDALAVVAFNGPCGTFTVSDDRCLFCVEMTPECEFTPAPECDRPFDGAIQINATLLDEPPGEADGAALYIIQATDLEEFAIVTVAGFDPETFIAKLAAQGTADGAIPEHAVSADLNNDGSPDYIVANVVLTPIDASRGRIKVMDGGGPSGLTGVGDGLNPDIDIDLGGVAFGIDAADADGDGDIDITVGFTPSAPLAGTTFFRTYTGEPPQNSSIRLNNNEMNDEAGPANAQAFKLAHTTEGTKVMSRNFLTGTAAGVFDGIAVANEMPVETCPGDLNGDNVVDIADLILAIITYDKGGIVQLLEVLSGWGPC